MPKTIPIIDLFAGPGGLGEGFSAFKTGDGHFPFEIALSIEKEAYAHSTLTLRSFFRQFPDGEAPDEYYEYLRSIDEPEPIRRRRLFGTYPKEAEKAKRTALHEELGQNTTLKVRDKIDEALEKKHGEFILLGGPPCQAYSIVGRSRNKGIKDYNADEDVRQTLYVEYLQVIADHKPLVFVMENVKGLLSATLKNKRIFERIHNDLELPADALKREGRSPRDKRERTRYKLFPLVVYGNRKSGDPRAYTVQMERHGIPQARHRLILVGVRDDLSAPGLTPLAEAPPVSVGQVLGDLPRVRSGLSKEPDSLEAWKSRILEAQRSAWFNNGRVSRDKELADLLSGAISVIAKSDLDRGAEFVLYKGKPDCPNAEWFEDSHMEGICNHTTRVHIAPDLHRYLFAACYGQVHQTAPELPEFPTDLLPNHKNAKRAVKDGTFDDRFRVQLADRPSTTVTSHLAKDGHYFIHPDPTQCRSITVREAARLQTFPDNYFFCGPRTAQYIQVGNAVPPFLAHQIASSIFGLMKSIGKT